MRSSGRAASGGRPARGRGLVAGGVVTAAWLVPLAVNPWGFSPFGPAKAFVLAACALSVAVGLALDGGRLPRLFRGLWASWVARAVSALWFLVLLSTIVSLDPVRSLVGSYPEYQGVVTWLAVTTVGLGAISLKRSEIWPRIARAVSVSLVVMGAVALAQALGFDPTTMSGGDAAGRVATTLGNPSNAGVYMLLAIPLVFERLRNDKSLGWRITAGAALLVALAMLLFSGSRGAWLGLLVASVLWLVVEYRRWDRGSRRRKIALVLVCAVLVALAATVLSVPRLRERVGSAGTATIEWRFIAWGAAGNAALDRPLLGWGPDSFRDVYVSYWPTEVQAGAAHGTTVSDPHNVVASTAASLGFPGVLVLLGLIVATGTSCVSMIKKRRTDDLQPVALVVALTGGLVALMFHFFTLDTLPVVAVLLGLLVGERVGPARPRASKPSVSKHHGLVRAGSSWMLVAVLAIMTVATVGLIGADGMMRSAFASTGESAWTAVKDKLHTAQTLAPWEPTFDWATGKAAIQALGRNDHAAVYVDGLQALDAVSLRLPREPGVRYDTAYLKMSEGIATGDEGMLREAEAEFRALKEVDPNNPTYWSAHGLAVAALGDREQAVEDLRTAILLAPNNAAYQRAFDQLQE